MKVSPNGSCAVRREWKCGLILAEEAGQGRCQGSWEPRTWALLAHLPHKERARMALGAVMSNSEGVAGSSGDHLQGHSSFCS